MHLSAVLLNCTLKKSPEISNTQALMDHVIDHLVTSMSTANPFASSTTTFPSASPPTRVRVMTGPRKEHPIPPEGNTVPMKHGG